MSEFTNEVVKELRYRAWQERASARIGRTSKRKIAEHEHAAFALECLADHLERGLLPKIAALQTA